MSTVKALAGCAVVGGLAGLAGGYFGAGLHGKSARGEFSEITTHRLVLVNTAGARCGGLEGGNPASPEYAALSLGGPTPGGPKVVLSVDSLEGEPTAIMYLRSPGIAAEETGILTVRSSLGWPWISLSGPSPWGSRQHVELGMSRLDQQTVLRLERGPESIAAWPK